VRPIEFLHIIGGREQWDRKKPLKGQRLKAQNPGELQKRQGTGCGRERSETAIGKSGRRGATGAGNFARTEGEWVSCRQGGNRAYGKTRRERRAS